MTCHVPFTLTRVSNGSKICTRKPASFVLHYPKVNFDAAFCHYEASFRCANERYMLKSADNMFSGPITMSPYITRCQHQGWMRVTGEYIICLVLKRALSSNLLYIINLFACMKMFVCHMFTVVVLFEYSEHIRSTEAVLRPVLKGTLIFFFFFF